MLLLRPSSEGGRTSSRKRGGARHFWFDTGTCTRSGKFLFPFERDCYSFMRLHTTKNTIAVKAEINVLYLVILTGFIESIRKNKGAQSF
jgi:hypothetical protein